MARFGSYALAPMFAALLFGLAGCGADGTPEAPGGCPGEDQIGGACAGVPQAAVCAGGGACTSGVACTSVVDVEDAASLGAAAAGAAPGSCIALAPGSYGAVSLPGGVSLLGASASDVHVEGVTIGAGDGAVLRGVTVGSGGVTITSATGVRVESTRVDGSAGAGVDIGPGSTVSIITSEISGSAYHGIKTADATDLTLDRSIIQGSVGPGILGACDGDCACEPSIKLTATASILRENHIAGVSLFGVAATFADVDILATRRGDQWHYLEGGGGLSVAACSTLTAVRTRVIESDLYGVLVDDASASLGGAAEGDGVEIRRNVVGAWFQNIGKTAPQTVLVENSLIEGNEGVGIGVSGETRGLIICRSKVSGTTTKALPVKDGGNIGAVQEVGHGLAWLEGSEVTLTSVTLSANALSSVLIDGEATGSMANVTLTGGDEQKGIVQQNYTGGQQPELKANTPAVTAEAGQLFQIPLAPPAAAKSL